MFYVKLTEHTKTIQSHLKLSASDYKPHLLIRMSSQLPRMNVLKAPNFAAYHIRAPPAGWVVVVRWLLCFLSNMCAHCFHEWVRMFLQMAVCVNLELTPRRAVADGSSAHAVDIVIDVGRWEAVVKHSREELHFSLTTAASIILVLVENRRSKGKKVINKTDFPRPVLFFPLQG